MLTPNGFLRKTYYDVLNFQKYLKKPLLLKVANRSSYATVIHSAWAGAGLGVGVGATPVVGVLKCIYSH